MREYKDEAYIFSLSKYDPGKIIACRTPSGGKDTGRNIFSCLKMSEEERDFFKEASATYGNLPIGHFARVTSKKRCCFSESLFSEPHFVLPLSSDLTRIGSRRCSKAVLLERS